MNIKNDLFVPGDRLVLHAPAKINLFLKITGRRPDGYHTLETRMQKLALFDELVLGVSDKPGVRLRCFGADLPEDSGNIVWRAADFFLQNCPLCRPDKAAGVDITLNKKIPLAAGLGGGSSDAAACLRGLNTLFASGMSQDQLAAVGLRLGADVPFFLLDSPAALARGIGEILHPVAPLRSARVLLINPGFPLSTKWAYQSFALTEKKNAGNLTNPQNAVYEKIVREQHAAPEDWACALVNDLERVSMASFPEIRSIKEELRKAGAFASLMSGSGPTVFGLFTEHSKASNCLSFFAQRYPHVFLLDPLTGQENFA